MVLEGEKVSIAWLIEYTGFFYKNPMVRQEIDQTLDVKAGEGKPTGRK